MTTSRPGTSAHTVASPLIDGFGTVLVPVTT